MSILPGGIVARLLVPSTPVARARTSDTPTVHSQAAVAHVRSSQAHPRSCAYFKHSNCPFPAAFAHVRSVQGHPFSCAYFKHSKCPSRRHSSHVSSSQGHPLLVRVLQTLQMSIHGGIPRTSTRPKDTRARARTSNTPNVHLAASARPLVPRHLLVRVLQTFQVSQGHPCSCAYFKHSNVHRRPRTFLVPITPLLVRVLQTLQMSIRRLQHVPRPKDTRARARTSNTPNVHSGGILARPLVPRTPVLVRVLQTLQMSILGGIPHVLSSQSHPCSCAYFKHSKFPFWRQTRTSTRPTAPRARARTSNILNP